MSLSLWASVCWQLAGCCLRSLHRLSNLQVLRIRSLHGFLTTESLDSMLQNLPALIALDLKIEVQHLIRLCSACTLSPLNLLLPRR